MILFLVLKKENISSIKISELLIYGFSGKSLTKNLILCTKEEFIMERLTKPAHSDEDTKVVLYKEVIN